MDNEIVVPILEKDISKFIYKDVLGNSETPKIVIIKYSAIGASYLYVLIDNFSNDQAFLGYGAHMHPLVKTGNKWILTKEYPYYWGKITKIDGVDFEEN